MQVAVDATRMSEHHIGQRIRELHIKGGYKTATAAAKAMGISRQAVSEVYRTAEPGDAALAQYTRLVRKKPEDVLAPNQPVSTGAWDLLIAASGAIGEEVATTVRAISTATPEQRKAIASMVEAFLSHRR